MAYTAEISRSNPACIIFLVDRSGSMASAIGGDIPQPKAEVVADAINRLLYELTIKCAKESGVRDYFQVSVIGYGESVGPAFSGKLAERDLIPLSLIADNPARVDQRIKKVPDGAGGLVDTTASFPVWMEPVAHGGTPMNRALRYANNLVATWVEEHPGGFPPIVLNLTDGQSTDGDPAEAGSGICTHTTADGSPLLFNLHVSAAGGQPVTFPRSDKALPNSYSRLLFGMSSPLPGHMRSYAASLGHRVSDETRGFVYNADISAVVQFLDIGTRATDLR
ncbi:VWA domain-containing protein [Streptomyces sp. NBC_01016]|uniref:vWA domain-containing protein n=1 Tax=Streptomyces sp. NBC_01016 TaxID=2903720 RepID=UPI00225237C8|nr:vWA domain-containing protein [Streptomyces sp. NBC_01016]MCX4829669.1 VWA domain-containing protein [Streptomyces sp. NBC_01016]